LVAIKKKTNQMFERIKRFFGKENSNLNNNEGLKSDEVPFEIRMKKIENYFKKHSETDESFKPEFEAAKRVNQIILKERITKSDILEVVKIYNETNSKPHYDGSGWMDFRLHLQSLIRKSGMESTITKNRNIEIVKENSKLPNETNLYGVIEFRNLTKEILANKFQERNWKLRKSSWVDFEVENEWSEIEIKGKNEILISGIIIQSKFEELVNTMNEMNINFEIELYNEKEKIKTATNKS